MKQSEYFPHVPSADIEDMDRHVGMAESLCPRADCQYRSLRPDAPEKRMRARFLNAIRNICGSAALQCSGSTEYEATAARNRARIAADHQAEGRMLEKLNRRASRVNRMAA